MVNFASKIVTRWRALSEPLREAIAIAVVTVSIWLVIERTETCDRIFDWVAQNPDAEADSVILAFILAALAITGFAVRRYNELVRANAQRDVAQQRARELAYHDPLTGLSNRHALNEKLASIAESGPREVALVLLDLDRFKQVNDVHGHAAGDRLLRLVASRLRGELKLGQSAYRLGGDEFALITDVAQHDAAAVLNLARRCIGRMCEPFDDNDLVHHIGASAGVAMFPTDTSDPQALLRFADIALYRAKDAGRGQVRSYDVTMDVAVIRRAEIERRMRAALNTEAFQPYFQPIVDLASGQPIAFELLARWLPADGEAVGPDEFIPIAEETGLINSLTLHLLERACDAARDWTPALPIALNISPVQLRDPWLAERILGLLVRKGFPPQRFMVEITENALIDDSDAAKRMMESFRNQGIRIGLDDFGTGYSSLAHLRMLPFDKIKIDKSFVLGVGQDPESTKIIRAISSLAKSLDLPVVAEGVETQEAAELLLSLGCSQAQGFFFGRASSGDDVARLLLGGEHCADDDQRRRNLA